MKNQLYWQKIKTKTVILSRILLFLALVAILEIFIGIERMISDTSPDVLGSYSSLRSSFMSHYADHTFILIGSLVLTIVVWGLTQNFWQNK